jgi:TorA maturation chaperone TorD
MGMTNTEKGDFCALAASLMAPPDAETVGELKQGEIQSLLEKNIREWGGDPQLLTELASEKNSGRDLATLQKEYERLFAGLSGQKISLVESTYKPWTGDDSCALAFAGDRGLLMGDAALHMREIYRQSSLEVPEEFRSTPDHLLLELEFLSLLYHSAAPEQIQGFIEDHLDWVPDLKERLDQADLHPFYRKAVELINLFLEHERKEGKAKNHGPKNLH